MVYLSVNKNEMARVNKKIPLKKLDFPCPLEPKMTLILELRSLIDCCSYDLKFLSKIDCILNIWKINKCVKTYNFGTIN
jgi:hypothetical protein